MLELDNTNNGGEVEFRVGDTFELRLSENPTTGYRWFLSAPVGPVLEIEDDSFTGARQGAVGAGGARVWRFRAAREGVVRLELENRRSWEPRGVATFAVAIDVKAP
ncbi:MAG TPA: protease inhibitor I42 family protein [Methylocystis sp.]|jgi:inhibitor of cysteine peptidase